MKKLTLIGMMAFAVMGHAQHFSWIKQFNGNYNKDLERDAAGNMYLVADYLNYTCGSNHLQSTSPRYFIAKYGSNDSCLWVKNWPVSHDETAMDESGALYITGRFSGLADFNGSTLTSRGDEDIYVAKLNANGDVVWLKQIGGPDADRANDISVKNGFVDVTGSFGSAVTVESNTYTEVYASAAHSFFLARFSTAGTFSWLQQSANRGDAAGNEVGTDDAGNAYVMVSCSDTAVFGTFSLDQDNSPYGMYGMVKYNSSGLVQWGKNFGNIFRLSDQNFAVDKNGNNFVITQFTYSPESVRKFDTNGNPVWTTWFGGSYGTDCSDVKVHDSGDLILTGGFWPEGDFGTIQYPSSSNGKMYVARLNTSGVFTWLLVAESNEEPTTARPNAVALSSSDRCYLTGSINGNGVVHFGQQNITRSNGNSFLARIDSTTVTSSHEFAVDAPEGIRIHPNPNTGKFTIDLCMNVVETEGLTIEVTNHLGQVVYRSKPAITGNCVSEVIELEKGLPAGVYILNVISNETKQSKQLVLAY